MKQDFIKLSNDNIHLFFDIFQKSLIEQTGSSNNFDRFNNYIKFLDVNESSSFIINEDRKQIGMFLGAIRGNYSYIPAIVVLENYRRQGYGRILLQKGISLLLENNCSQVTLDVLKDNSKAIQLYKSEGFEIKNEIINFRNENNSYHSKNLHLKSEINIQNTYNNINIIKDGGFTFNFLYKSFHHKPVPWHRGLRSILSRIETQESELYLIQKDNKTIGYIIVTRNNNILQINDIGINFFDSSILAFVISCLIKIERVVQINSFYSFDPICKLFEELGFYIDSIQYEMHKNLI